MASTDGGVSLPQDPVPETRIDAAVTRALAMAGLPDHHVAEISATIKRVNEGGLMPRRVFPKGQPVPDGAWVEGLIGAGQVSEVLVGIGGKDFIDEIRLFPLGIIDPEFFRVQIGIR